jgi:hypothetical protein
VYAALSTVLLLEATSVCGLKLLVHAVLSTVLLLVALVTSVYINSKRFESEVF